MAESKSKNMSKETIDVLEVDELEVKEVRCAQTGIPIAAIPNWYANVNVKFVSDHARSKSGGTASYLRIAELNEPDPDEPSDPAEISLDEIDEDLTVDDEIEIDLGDDLETDEE